MKKLEDYIYYEEPAGVIYCGDCLEVLPLLLDESIDLVVTDPPYGIGGTSGTKGKMRSHKLAYNGFLDSPEYIKKTVIPAFKLSLQICNRAIVTPGPICLCYYPNPDSFGCLWQPATVAMQKWGRADSQPIFYYGKDPRSGKTIDFCSIKNTEGPPKTIHPCAKPIKIWSWLLNKGSLVGQLILDPFLGSGTTALAAKQLGRKFIGIEIEPKYCEIAKIRLSQEELFNQ
jgi:DNA modification methylase